MSQEFLTIDPATASTRDLHGYLLGATSPRPIGFASTISPDGTPNLAPFSFFNVFSSNPPILIFSPARRVRGNTTKHTLENVIGTPQVVINTVSYGMVHQMNLASSEYPEGVNEFKKAGFSELESDLVLPPRVGESPVQMECKVVEIKPLSAGGGGGNLIICRVLKIHVNKAILDEHQRIDPHKIDLVGRMGGPWYSRTSREAAFLVPKPGTVPGVGVDAFPDSIRRSKILTGNDLGILGDAESLPRQEEIAIWWESVSDEIKAKSYLEMHQLAQAEIQVGNRKEAILLLMASDMYGKR